MSMKAEEKIARHRLSVLELAEALGSVSEACRRRDISRTQYYEYKRRFDNHSPFYWVKQSAEFLSGRRVFIDDHLEANASTGRCEDLCSHLGREIGAAHAVDCYAI